VVSGGAYDAKTADVWSAGVVLHTILAGAHPYRREKAPGEVVSGRQMARAVIDGKVRGEEAGNEVRRLCTALAVVAKVSI
jgi:hypothetical protein